MFKIPNLLKIIPILLIFVSSCTTDESCNTVTDIDGNVYHTIKIGTQVWMVENLKTTKYRNGDFISTTNPANIDVSLVSTPKYQWVYKGNNDNVSKYGRLYTGYAVSDNRNIAPVGWHIPTDAEWEILEEYVVANLGTSGSVAKLLASKTDWDSSTNEGAIGNDLTKNNNYGFTGLPGGYRSSHGPFDSLRSEGYWWTSTQDQSSNAIYRFLRNSSRLLHSSVLDKHFGLSVRCVKDY